MAKRISIIGCGAVGRSFGAALRQAGFRIGALTSKERASAHAARVLIGGGEVVENVAEAARSGDVVLLTVPDSVVTAVCEEIAQGRGFVRKQVVLHCSGALTAEALASARKFGAAVGALHPLQSFAGADEAVHPMKGTVFTFQGDADAALQAHTMVEKLSGKLYVITEEGKAAYHAASVFASNYLVAIAQIASTLAAKAGIPERESLKALLPLMRGTLDNLDKIGLPNSLTGPIARGDVRTIAMHLDALGKSDPLFDDAYRDLGLVALRIALLRGTLTPEQAERIRSLLRD